MAFKLATAWVEIKARTTMLRRGLSMAKDLVVGTLQRLAGVAAQFGSLAGGISIGAAVKLAADAEEMQAKFDTVFKATRVKAEAFAKDFADKVGRSVNDVKDSMAGFQDILVPLGFGRDAAEALSEQLVQVGTDLASANNKSDIDARRALVGALTGERDMLKQFGVVLLESDVKQELFRRGQDKLTGSALRQAKAQATLHLIMKQSSDAMGDAARTAGSFTNRVKALWGLVKDLLATIGGALLPALTKATSMMINGLKSIAPEIKRIAEAIRSWSAFMIDDWGRTLAIFNKMTAIALQFMGELLNIIPALFVRAMLKLVRKVGPMWSSIGKLFYKLYKAGWDNADTGQLLSSFFDAWKSGLGDTESVWDFTLRNMSDSLKQQIEELKGMFKEMAKAKADFDEEQRSKTIEDRMREIKETTKEAARMRAAQAKEDAEMAEQERKKQEEKQRKKDAKQMHPLRGLFGVEEASRRMQEALLEQRDPQDEMAGLLEVGNDIQKDIAKGVQELVRATIGGPQDPIAGAV